MDKEIREVYGKKYEVTKVPCTCYYHRSNALHIAACCDIVDWPIDRNGMAVKASILNSFIVVFDCWFLF